MSKLIAAPLSPQNAFRRVDESADESFYNFPRFVTHIDERAIEIVTELYREFFLLNGAILDLMSSWISHLPNEVAYGRVAGLGMNAEELAANPRLTEMIMQNLNAEPNLPFAAGEFVGAAICVSVQYLIEPVTVFGEIARVLKTDAPLVVTFSNRCFPMKAVSAWNWLGDEGHVELVSEYFAQTESFGEIEVRRHLPLNSDPLFGVIARKK
ncbi:MAG: methyltransferase type 11 [Acidobacteria bacterium]|jgi:SAM-dependent methyltransferase|nr:methyltransferase type 11 [Acidobacteriota bacterium]